MKNPEGGFEPPAPGSKDRCSATELLGNIRSILYHNLIKTVN